ncbi:MAG: hypothetical protein K9L24_03665 [Spirochaetia bacterium]|nr:hypothetical protein [Spirochaetia bacterium]
MEKYFIGQMIKDPHIAFQTKLKEKHFQSQTCKLLFSTIRYLVRENLQPDIATIYAHNKTVTLSELMQIEDAVASAVNWQYYQDQIIEQHKRKEIRKVCEKILQDTFTPAKTLVNEIMQVVNFSEDDEYRLITAQESLDQTLEFIEESHNRKSEIMGISSGIRSLDYKLNGFLKRRLYIVGGRPSEGKTAFLINLLHNANCPVGFITAESSHKELTMRQISLDSKISSDRLTSGLLTQVQFDKVIESCTRIHGKDFIYHDEANMSLESLLLKAREMKQRYDVQALYIDYLQQITFNGREKRNEQVASVSSALKGLARNLDIPIICAAQLRRPPEGPAKPPKLHELGDSGQIERDADCVMMLYHGELLGEGDGTFMMIEKNRDGPTGYTKLMFKRGIYGFFDIDRNY